MERPRREIREIENREYNVYLEKQQGKTAIIINSDLLREQFSLFKSGNIPLDKEMLEIDQQTLRGDLQPIIAATLEYPEFKSFPYMVGVSILNETIEQQYQEKNTPLPPETSLVIPIKTFEMLDHIAIFKKRTNMLDIYRQRFEAMKIIQPAFKDLQAENPSLLAEETNLISVAGMLDTYDVYNIAERLKQKQSGRKTILIR